MSTIKYQSRELLVCRIIEFLTPRQQSINLDRSKFKELVKRNYIFLFFVDYAGNLRDL